MTDNPSSYHKSNNNKLIISTQQFNTIYSIFASPIPSLKNILPLLIQLKETALEEPEIFTILFPSNNSNYFFELLIHIYLNILFQSTPEALDTKHYILSLLFQLSKYYDFKWETYEIIYDFLSKYLRNEQNLNELTANVFEQILSLMEILYGVVDIINIKKYTFNEVDYLPNSFFVHNGKGVMKRNINGSCSNIENGLNIAMWFYCKKPTRVSKEKSTLIEIILTDNTNITVELVHDYSNVKLIVKDQEEIHTILLNQWYMMELTFIPGSLFGKHSVCLTFSSFTNFKQIEKFVIKCDIAKDIILQMQSLYFYRNFYGISTSLLILNNSTKLELKDKQKQNQNISFLTFKYGAHDPISGKFYYDILKSKIFSFYVPYNCIMGNREIIVNDSINGVNIELINFMELSRNMMQLLSHFRGHIILINNNFNVYSKLNVNIQKIRGINTLLPLFHLIVENDKELMTSTLFEHLMNFIIAILRLNQENYLYAINTNFFYFLSRYLEILPSRVYSNNIYKCFCQLKELFEYNYNYVKINSNEQNNDNKNNPFIEYIYLNTKIIKKFSFEIQNQLFNYLLSIIEEDKKQSKQEINQNTKKDNSNNDISNNSSLYEKENFRISFKQIKPLCNTTVLSKYMYSLDKENNIMFCCYKHAPKGSLNILNPPLYERVLCFSKLIIKLLEKDFNSGNEMLSFFNFLCLNLSPCMQLICIETLKGYIMRFQYKDDKEQNILKLKCHEQQTHKVIFHLIKDGIWEIKLKAIELLIEYMDKIDYVFDEKDFSILKEIIIADSSYVNVKDVLSKRKAYSVKKEKYKERHKRTFSQNKCLDKCDVNKILNYSPITKPKEIDKIEKLKELNFIDCFLNYVKEHSNENDSNKNEYKLIQKRKKVLIINDNLFDLYDLLISWISKLNIPNSTSHLSIQNKQILINQIFSLIIFLIKKSLSYKFLQKFLDYLKENKHSHFFHSQELIHFLLETSAHFLTMHNVKFKNNHSLSIKVNQPFHKNFPNIIIPTLLDVLADLIFLNIKPNNTNSFNLEYILTWLTYHQFVSNKYKKIIHFIDTLFQKVIDIFFLSGTRYLNLLLNDVSSYNNLAIFVNIFFEYITFHQISLSLLTQQIGDIEIYDSLSSMKIPSFLFTWVNANDNNNKLNIFTSFYNHFQSIWNINKYQSNINGKNETKRNLKLKIINYLIDQFVYCSKKTNYNVLLNEIEFLFLPNIDSNENQFQYLSLMKIFFFFLIVNITIEENKNDLSKWLNELENYIIFIIIGSLNSYNKLTNEHNKTIIAIISYSLNFIFDQIQSTPKENEIYNETLDILFYTFYNIIIHRKFKTLFEKTAFYSLFCEYIITKNGKNIILHHKSFDIKINKMFDTSVFYNENTFPFWNESLINNDKLKTIFHDFYSTHELLSNIIKRYNDICNIYPLYEIKKHKQNEKLIEALGLKRNEYYIEKEYKGCLKLINDITLGNVKTIIKAYINIKKEKQNIKKTHSQYYKRLISLLFKYRGSWSDKKEFYTNIPNFPNKYINHYALNMTLPFITPIINKDYPLLNSSDSNNMQLISYNVELYFSKMKKKFSSSNLNKKFITNIHNIYKRINFGNLWEMITNYKTGKIDLCEDCNEGDNNKNLPENDNIFIVCLVKQTHHIKGNLEIKQSYLNFVSENHPINVISNDGNYSLLSLKCRGSFHKDSIINYNIQKRKLIHLNKIKYIFIRNYYFPSNAIEIFTFDNKGYYFHFIDKTQQELFLDKIKKDFNSLTLDSINDNPSPNIIGYINSKYKARSYEFESIETLFNNWIDPHSISTFTFIMWLNILSGRSYKDISKYPIYPWPITNYTSNTIDSSIIRDFSKSIEMLDINYNTSLKKDYINHENRVNILLYKEVDLLFNNTPSNQISHHNEQFDDCCGTNISLFSHLTSYSHNKSVLSFLNRIYPFKSISISKENTFNSFNDSFINAISTKHEFNEITPEFYYFCEFLTLSSPQIQKVILPTWSNSSSYKVITSFRQILEENQNQNIEKWIELIFSLQQNEESQILHNYSESLSLNDKEEIIKPAYLHLISKGISRTNVIPFPMNITSPIQYKQLKISNNIIHNLEYKCIDPHNLIYPICFKAPEMFSQVNEITIVLSDLSIRSFRLIETENAYSIEDISIYNINENIDDVYKKTIYNNTTKTLILYQECSIIKCGYCDGTIKHFYINDTSTMTDIFLLEYDKSIVTAMAITSKQNIILFGSHHGTVMVYKIIISQSTDEYFTLKIHKVISDHTDEIVQICVNDILQIVATSSYDEYIYIYTMPTFKCIRSFHFPNYIADKILISANPLPVIVFYCEEAFEFKIFTVNGSEIKMENHFVNKEGVDVSDDIRNKNVTCFEMFTDLKYFDYLITGTNDGYVIIREFPSLKVKEYVKVFDCNYVNNKKENVEVKFVVSVLNGKGVLVYGNNKRSFQLILMD